MHERQREGKENGAESEDGEAEKIRRNEGLGDERIFDPASSLGNDPHLLFTVWGRLCVSRGRNGHGIPPIVGQPSS